MPVLSRSRNTHTGVHSVWQSVSQVQKMAAASCAALLRGSSDLLLEMDLLAGNLGVLIFCLADTCKSWWGRVAFPLLSPSSWFQNGVRTEWAGPEWHCQQEWWTKSLGHDLSQESYGWQGSGLGFFRCLLQGLLLRPPAPTRICVFSVFTLRKNLLLEPWFISKCKMDVLDALMLIGGRGLRARCSA